MGEIYLIRHGQASFGKGDYDRLSELGERQSSLLAGYLKSVNFLPDAIYCGPLKRHKGTAQALFEAYEASDTGLPQIEIMDEFREYDARAIIRKTLEIDPSLRRHMPTIYENPESFRKVFGASIRAWVTGLLDDTDVEKWEELKKRVFSAMAKIRDKHGPGVTVAVFTSGGPIAASLSSTLGISGLDSMRLNWHIVNTSVTRYVFDEKSFTLAGFNSMAHLRLAGDPTLVTWY